MIDFKENCREILPYDRDQYIDSFDDDSISPVKWYGVSFQLSRTYGVKDNKLTQFVEIYQELFKNVILKLDRGSCWIVNHDDKDLSWFPDEGDNLSGLRRLFKENNIPNTFKGAMIFTKDDLLAFSGDLLSYPYAVLQKDGFLYKDLNVSHGELQFVIKISGHLNVDFLSTSQQLLKELVNESFSDPFVVKEYRGTSLY